MKKNLLFTLMAVFLAGFGFGGVSMADCTMLDGSNDAQESYSLSAVAQIGDNCYTTLQKAISSVTPNEATTIKLLQDVDNGGGVFITGDLNLNITIDFSGYTYTAKDPAVGSEGTETQALHIEKNNNVTLINGTFVADGTKNKNMKMGIQNYSNLVLDNFTLDASKLAWIYATSNNFGSLTLKNKSNIIVPNNGVIGDVWYGMSSDYDEGVQIIFDSSFNGEISGIIEYGAKSRITGTDWTGKALIDLSAITNPALFDNVVFVSSSNHITNLSEQANIKLPDGYMLYSSDNKNYKLVKSVAKINNKEYPSLQTAISSVTPNEATTIKLLQDVDNGGGVFITGDLNLNITIDFSGYTYTAKDPAVGSEGTETQALHIEKNNNVTLINGTFVADGTKNKNMKMGIQNYSNLVLDNFTLDASKLAWIYATSNNFGSLTLKNKSNIIVPNNGVIGDVWYGMSSDYDEGVQIIFDSSFNGEISGIIEYGAKSRITGTDWTGKALIDLSAITNPALFDNVVFVSSSNHITNLSEQANIKLPDGYMLYSSDNKNYKLVKSLLSVNFNTDGGNTIVPLVVNYGSKVAKPADPIKSCNRFDGWYVGNDKYDFDATVTGDLTLVSKWTYTCSSSGGGSGVGSSSSSSSSSSSKTTATTNNTGSNTTGANTTSNSEEINLGGEVTEEPTSTSEETSTPDNGYSKEFNDAYTWAFKNGITTMSPIEKADMNAPLTRIAMAKMLSQYAINVLGRTPDTTKVVPAFPDVSAELDAAYNSGVTLAYQLGIMGINIDKFRPDDLVTRAEFGTALSRMLYATADGEKAYYETHLAKLMEEKIITVDTPDLQELRGYVMIMLMRSANK